MTKQEKLIEYYTALLNKVISQYAGDERKSDYIEHAKRNLKEVKNGRNW